MNIIRTIKPFSDPDITAKGDKRAEVRFDTLKTLWFNTGTLCNIECAHCYIESSPTNDRLVYLTPDDVAPYFDEIDELGSGPVEIGFTGGEPFMNPHMIELADMALSRGHEVLILTNAMKPMMRPRVQEGLLELQKRYPQKITLRISLDHHSARHHDEERGKGSFDISLEGMDWLSANGFSMTVAGRSMWHEDETAARQGFADLFVNRGYQINAADPAELVIFPEMDEAGSPPEITTECWDILSIEPSAMMCASSRMVVRRKGADHASVLSCTLIPYDESFEMASSLKDSLRPVKLNHRFCAQFCVLGGASCSA